MPRRPVTVLAAVLVAAAFPTLAGCGSPTGAPASYSVSGQPVAPTTSVAPSSPAVPAQSGAATASGNASSASGGAATYGTPAPAPSSDPIPLIRDGLFSNADEAGTNRLFEILRTNDGKRVELDLWLSTEGDAGFVHAQEDGRARISFREWADGDNARPLLHLDVTSKAVGEKDKLGWVPVTGRFEVKSEEGGYKLTRVKTLRPRPTTELTVCNSTFPSNDDIVRWGSGAQSADPAGYERLQRKLVSAPRFWAEVRLIGESVLAGESQGDGIAALCIELNGSPSS